MPATNRPGALPRSRTATALLTPSLLSATALALVLTSCRSTPPPGAAPPSASTVSEFEALYRARTAADATRIVDADVRFVRAMLSHHADGREMAWLGARQGHSRAVRLVSARILSNYEHEITVLRHWLSDRQLPIQALETTLTAVGTARALNSVPGTPTLREMEELRASSGIGFDRLFLEMNIRHHEAAVSMVQAMLIAGGGQDRTVRSIVSGLEGEQATYVARMKTELARLSPQPPG